MTIEKSFTDFIILHEKKILTKDIKNLEGDIISITERIENISSDKKEINEIIDKLSDNLRNLKIVLTKNNLYEL